LFSCVLRKGHSNKPRKEKNAAGDHEAKKRVGTERVTADYAIDQNNWKEKSQTGRDTLLL